MAAFVEQLRRWKAIAGETQALLARNDQLLEMRAALIRSANAEFRAVVLVARRFASEVAGPDSDQEPEPAARSGSPRSR